MFSCGLDDGEKLLGPLGPGVWEKMQGVPARGGTWLMVFLRILDRYRPKNATSRDPYPLRATTPTPGPPFKPGPHTPL